MTVEAMTAIIFILTAVWAIIVLILLGRSSYYLKHILSELKKSNEYWRRSKP